MALYGQPRWANIMGGIHRKMHERKRGKIHKLESVNGKLKKNLRVKKNKTCGQGIGS